MHRPGPGDRGRGRAALTQARDPDPKHVVARGYDAIADRYADWSQAFVSVALARVAAFEQRLPARSRVLDVGCGAGFPARVFAERHDVVGIDISAGQIERARRAVPGATFLCADATEVELDEGRFDAIVSLYMLGHVPRAEQEPLLRRFARWLRPGGVALLTMATGGSADGVEPDWLGTPMFFASFDPERNRELVRRAGLELVDDRQVPQHEPGHGVVSFMWIEARKP